MMAELEKLKEFARQRGFLVQFTIMCAFVFAVIMWVLLAFASVLWFFMILAQALTSGVVILLWLIPWSAVAAVLITALLAVLATGIFD